MHLLCWSTIYLNCEAALSQQPKLHYDKQSWNKKLYQIFSISWTISHERVQYEAGNKSYFSGVIILNTESISVDI